MNRQGLESTGGVVFGAARQPLEQHREGRVAAVNGERSEDVEVRSAGALDGRTEGCQGVIDVKERIANLAQQLAMPAEHMLGRIFNESGTNGVQVDVQNQLVEVPLTVQPTSPDTDSATADRFVPNVD